MVPRISRWWIYMQDFNFDIAYRKGSSLPHVDYLSRNPVSQIRRVSHNNWTYVEQIDNEVVQHILKQLSDGDLDSNQYVEKDGMLYHKRVNADKTIILQWFVPR